MELSTKNNLLNVVNFFQIQVLEFNTVVTFVWKLCSKYFYASGKILKALQVQNYLIFTATLEIGTIIMLGKKIRCKEVR